MEQDVAGPEPKRRLIRARRTQTGVAYLELAPGVRFFDTFYYSQVLGMTRKEFHELCRRLQVPCVRLGRRYYVRYEIFLAACTFVSLLGQPDFIGLGTLSDGEYDGDDSATSEEDRKNGSRHARRWKPRRRVAYRLSLADYYDNQERVVSSILWGLRTRDRDAPPHFETSVREAVADFFHALRTIQLTCGAPHESILPSPPPGYTGKPGYHIHWGAPAEEGSSAFRGGSSPETGPKKRKRSGTCARPPETSQETGTRSEPGTEGTEADSQEVGPQPGTGQGGGAGHQVVPESGCP